MAEDGTTGSRLTACIITLNEEDRLPACLESVAFCDEVVVVDSGSQDRTREIAGAAGAIVVENPWPGFGAQRNVALERAGGDWVLEVDADERVSAELAVDIRRFLTDPPADVDVAVLPLRDLFLGRELGPSSRYPRYRNRLFRRGTLRHDESRTVHEGLWAEGAAGVLEGDLRHLLATSLSEAWRDALAYARLEAKQRSRPGAAEALKGIVARPLAKLAYRLLIYGGWRDGWQGFVRIGLECGGDSLAAVLRLGARPGEGADGFGQEPPRVGPVRIIGVALRSRDAAGMERWLAAAAEAGADVALVSGAGNPTDSVRRRVTEGSGPSAFVRALDAEAQVRSTDAIILAGRRERLLSRLVPRGLLGVVAPIDADRPPAEAVRALNERARAET